MARNKIIYDVGFNVEKNSLNSITSQLRNLQREATIELDIREGESARSGLQETIRTAEQVERALQDAYNPRIDSISLTKFNQNLKNSNLTLDQVEQNFSQMGMQGKAAFQSLSISLLNTNRELKTTNRFLDSMSQTFFSTLKWSVASGALNMFSQAFSSAWTYVKDLDQSLNNIRIVTGKSNEEMEKFAQNANKAAKALGSSTTDYTNASLIFYQQGLAEKEVKARTETTLKVANVTKQSTDAVSEQLTAIWNGYKVSAEEAELYIDKVAAVAASTASDLEELSDGMSKVASMAQAMGVDIDQLNGVLSTVISVTRQDASVVGTAFKTIFARMGDLAVGGEDEFGVKLGEVSGKLQQMGIDVLDQTGNLRDMGTVIEEVAAKWDTWTEAQQQAAAGALAGKRQINNLLALFENWDMYESAVATSQNSEGTLQEQQDTYMDSLEAKFEQISASAERVYSAIFDSESMKDFLEILAEVIEEFGKFTEAIGGGGNLLLLLGSIALTVFKDQIGMGIMQVVRNSQTLNQNEAQRLAQMQLASQLQESNNAKQDAAYKRLLGQKEKQIQLEKYISKEEHERINKNISLIDQERGKLIGLNKEKERINQILQKNNINASIGNSGEFNWEIEQSNQKKAALDSYNQSIQQNNQSIQENKQLLQEQNLSNEKCMVSVNNLKTSTDSLLQSNRLDEQQKQRIISANNKAQQSIQTAITTGKGWEQTLQDIINAEKVNNQVLEELQNELNEIQIEARQTGTEMKKAGEDIDVAFKDIDRSLASGASNKTAADYTQLTASLMSLTFVVSSITNVFETFSDTSMSSEEKIRSLFTTILMFIPMAISMISSIKNAAVSAGIEIQAAWWWLIGIVAAIAVAVAAIVLIADAFQKAAKKEEIALDNARKSAEKCKEAYEEMTSALQNLKDAFDNLDSITEKMEQLKKGTEEWKQALLENNQQVLDLVTNYDELSKYVSVDSDGKLVISEEGRQKILEKQQKITDASEGAYLGSLANKGKAQVQLDYKKQAEKITKDYNWFWDAISFGGFAIESQRWENNTKAILEEYSKKIASGEINLALESDRDKLRNVYDNLELEDTRFDEFISTLEKNSLQIKENNRLTDLQNKTLTRSFLANDSEFSNMSESEKERFVAIYDYKIENYKDTEEYKTDVEEYHVKAKANRDEFLADYLDSIGYGGYDAEINSDNYIVVKDEKGEEIFSHHVMDAIDTLVTDEYRKEILDEVKKNFEVVKSIETKIKTTNPNNSIYATGFAKDSEPADLSNFKVQDIEKLVTASHESFVEAFGSEEALDAYAKAWQYTDAKDYELAVAMNAWNTLQAKDTGYKNIKEKYGAVNAAIFKAQTSGRNFTLNEKNAFSTAYQKALDVSDAAGLAFAKLAGDINSNNITDEQAATIATTSASIDWTSETAESDFIEALRAQGIAVDKSKDYWKNYLTAMEDAIIVSKETREELGFSASAWDNYVKAQGESEGAVLKTIQATLKVVEVNERLKKSYEDIRYEIKGLTEDELATYQKALNNSNVTRMKNLDSVVTLRKDTISSYDIGKFVQYDENGNITNLQELYTNYAGETEFLTAIENYLTALDERNEEVISSLSGMKDEAISSLDSINKKYDDYEASLQRVNKLLENQIELNKLLGNRSNNISLLQSKNANTLKEINNNYTQLQKNFELLGDYSIDELDEATREGIAASADSILSGVQEYMSNLEEIFSENLKGVIKNALGENLDYVNSDWDFTKKQNEKYLDNVNSEYEISKLSREYEKIAKTYDGNISAQTKLNSAIKTELDLLNQKDKLSKADLDRARAKLEVVQAEIALEEARRNATQMQLVRDASGNYSYTFVADTDAIAESEQKMVDAQNALYNLDKDRVVALQDEYLELWSEFDAEIQEAMKISDKEERDMRVAQLKEQYGQQFDDLKTEFNDLTSSMSGDISGFVNENIEAAISADIFKEGGALGEFIEDYKKETNALRDLIYGTDGTGGIYKTLSEVVNNSGFSVSLDSTAITNLTSTIGVLDNSIEDLVEEAKAIGVELDTWLKSQGIEFDTGGYTGEWGSTGKLAVLHQKELVLNAADTENILSAVSLVRSLGDMFNGLLLNADSFGNIPGLSSLLAQFNQSSGNNVAQSVLIEANFPNVTDRQEIQEAINNLISLAEQKANEKE